MDIRSYLDILWHRKIVVLFTTLAAVAAMAVAIQWMTPVYSASAVVRVTEGTGALSYTELRYADRVMSTYIYLLTSRPYLQQVDERLNLAFGPDSLDRAVDVTALANSELIRITAESTSPETAMAIANTLADLLVEEAASAGAERPARQVVVAEPAVAPEQPSRPQPALYLVLAAMLGLIGGLGLVFLFENLDTTVRSSRQLEAMAGVPLIGSIPVLSPGRFSGGPILLNGTSRPGHQEAFHMLGASALSAVSGGVRGLRTGKVLMVASAGPDAGKTTVLANLAVAVARAGYQVAVVDADLKRPSLHRIFGVESKPGLKEVLLNSVRVPQALRPSKIPGVKVMPVGASAGGSELLMNPVRIKQLLQQLTQEADFVFVDSPPVLNSADPAALGPVVDGVLLVVVRGESTEDDVKRALKQLQRVGAKTLGVVLNRSQGE